MEPKMEPELGPEMDPEMEPEMGPEMEPESQFLQKSGGGQKACDDWGQTRSCRPPSTWTTQ